MFLQILILCGLSVNLSLQEDISFPEIGAILNGMQLGESIVVVARTRRVTNPPSQQAVISITDRCFQYDSKCNSYIHLETDMRPNWEAGYANKTLISTHLNNDFYNEQIIGTNLIQANTWYKYTFELREPDIMLLDISKFGKYNFVTVKRFTYVIRKFPADITKGDITISIERAMEASYVGRIYPNGKWVPLYNR